MKTIEPSAASVKGRHATEMVVAYQQAPECPEAWAALVASVEGLIVGEAKRHYRRDPGYDFDDLIAAGHDGVREAATRFEAARGLAFTTYAPYWIRQSIARRQAIMSEAVHVPAYMRTEIAAWRKAGRPEDAAIEAAARMLRRPESISAQDANIHAWHWCEPSGRSDGPLALATARDEADWLYLALDRLAESDPRAAAIIRRRYGLDGDPPGLLREIAASLGLSKNRVQQIEERAVRHLREMAVPEGARPPKPRPARPPLGDCPACGKPYGSRRRDHVCRPAGASCDCPDCGKPFGKLRRCYWCNPPNRKAS